MRKTCALDVCGKRCDQPAVDFVMVAGGMRALWLCAAHYDRWIALAKALKRIF